MAKEKELNVEERLKALYELQTILSEVDRIKTLRGELPLEVQDLEDEIEGLQTRISKYDEEIAALNATIKEQSEAADKADAMVAKYTKDQDNVRNNREYDFLTKEIEYQQLNIELAEKKINDAKHAIDVTNANMDAATHVLAETTGQLDEIISETKQDEEKLREKAKKLEAKFDDERLLNAFKRTRKNARNGLGIVYVSRNACGGCFNRIPAQRQSEIKMHKKVIVCEYCGRILIDPEIVGVKAD